MLAGAGVSVGSQVKDVDDIVAVAIVADSFDLVEDALQLFSEVHVASQRRHGAVFVSGGRQFRRYVSRLKDGAGHDYFSGGSSCGSPSTNFTP
jgi:hypothetical protein